MKDFLQITWFTSTEEKNLLKMATNALFTKDFII